MWDAQSDSYQERHGPQLDESGGAAWGCGRSPNRSSVSLATSPAGTCSSSAAARRSGRSRCTGSVRRVVGLDLSARQLEHARELMHAAGAEFPLVRANAEATPFPDGSFDIVFCDHGAMTFADPYGPCPRRAPAARGGLLRSHAHAALDIAWSPGPSIPRPARRRLLLRHAMEFADEPTVFQLPYGTWIRLFGENGLVVEDLIELRPRPTRSAATAPSRPRVGAPLADGAHLARAQAGPAGA